MNEQLRAELSALIDERLRELKSKRRFEHVVRVAKPTIDPTSYFSRLDTLSSYQLLQITDIHEINAGSKKLQLYFGNYTVRLISRNRPAGVNRHDTTCFCAFNTKSDFGKSIIRPESMLDKVLDFFANSEYDFDEYPEFSSAFSCYSNHPDLLGSALNTRITSTFLESGRNARVEFDHKVCVVTNDNSVESSDLVLQLVDFSLRLREAID